MCYNAIEEIDKELIAIMKKLGNVNRYSFLHMDASSAKTNILVELGRRALIDPIDS